MSVSATNDWNDVGVRFTRTRDYAATVTHNLIVAGDEHVLVRECVWATHLDSRGWWGSLTPPEDRLLTDAEWITVTDLLGPYSTEADALRHIACRLTAVLIQGTRGADAGGIHADDDPRA